MGDRDWGRWQVIIAIIATAIALIGLVFQLAPTTPETPSETPKTQTDIVTTGSISVSSSPVGASVYLDGNYKGEVPQFLNDIEQGKHSITLKLEGYDDWYEDISVDADKTVSVSPTLTPIQIEPSPETSSSTGSISVTSSPTGADIFLDDTYEGETPKILEDIKQGSHTVTLTLAEYEDWSKDISVKADKTVSVSHTLIPTESSKDTSDTSKDTSDASTDKSTGTLANSAFISDSENVKTPTSVDISPYLNWSFTTSDSASHISVPEGYSYVTVTIHIKNDGDIPISTHESCWKFISNGDTYDYCEDISIALHRNYEMLEVNPGEETTFKIPYLVEGKPTTASLSYINPYTNV
ncbi:MAG TPA: PEGA domain-containing protein [Methanosarcina sp.]|jgi:hypothetical protein|nr:PEGA domain-containing protein [Methanosarcina sp.]